MKILNIHTSLGSGGTERVAVNFAIGYKRIEQDSRFLVIYGDGNRRIELDENNVPVFFYLKDREGVIKYLYDWRPDVIHFHRSLNIDPYVAEVIDRIKSSNTVVVETNVFSRYEYTKWYESQVDYSFQLSEWCDWKYRSWRGNRKQPLSHVVPNIVLSDNFHRAAQSEIDDFKLRYGIPPNNAKVAGRIGQPIDSKWSKHTIEAFEIAAFKMPELYLLLVGVPRLVKKQIEKLSEEFRSRIIIIDRFDNDKDLSVCYSSMDIFLHSSAIGESFGMVLVEAMLCEVPVISLSTPFKDNSQLEVVGHGTGGYIARNSQDMADFLLKLMADSYDYERIRSFLREWVISRYDQKIVCENLVLFYQKTLDKRFGYEDSRKCLDVIVNIARKSNVPLSLAHKIVLKLIHVSFLYKRGIRLKKLICSLNSMK
jgi:Glycosyltransferase